MPSLTVAVIIFIFGTTIGILFDKFVNGEYDKTMELLETKDEKKRPKSIDFGVNRRDRK